MSDYAARMRAARAYADLTQVELADRLGVDEQTIKRREAGKQDPKKGERIAVASICGVPPSFMEDGFGVPSPDEIVGRLERIEAALGGLVNYEELAARMRELIRRDAGPGATTPPTPEPSTPTADPDESPGGEQRPPREESV